MPKGPREQRAVAFMFIFRVATEPSPRPWSRFEISRGFDLRTLRDSREISG